MHKRVHSREFKLEIVRQIATGQRRPAQVCREYGLAESVLSRWRKEYQEQVIVLLVHTNGVRQHNWLALGIVDRRIEIANLTQAVAAQFQAIRQHTNANFA